MDNRALGQSMAWRLKTLREEKGLSHDSLSAALSAAGVPISRDSLIKYEQETAPKMAADKLLEIANFYGVSTDYLLFNSKVATTDATTRAICETTGLSEKAAENISGRRDWYLKIGGIETPVPSTSGLKPSQIMSRLLENDVFWQVLGNLSVCTTHEAREFLSIVDQHNPERGNQSDTGGYIETNPIFNTIEVNAVSLRLAAATIAFGEAAKAILSDYADEQKAGASSTNR